MFQYHNTVSCLASATVRLICCGKPQWNATRRARSMLTAHPICSFSKV